MRASRKHQRLYVNVDHVATLRQARRGTMPDPAAAAAACVEAGADGITAHLREDRRHIQDDDVATLRNNLRTYFNLELACTEAMLRLAIAIQPDQATLVPERREEVTTEGGLNLRADPERIREGVARLREAGIRTSLFIDPEPAAVELTREIGAEAVELHTGRYSHEPRASHTLRELQDAATRGAELELAVHAGHGLSIENVAPVAAIPEIEELNIGHAIISRAVFIGLHAAVREIREAMNAARGAELAFPAP